MRAAQVGYSLKVPAFRLGSSNLRRQRAGKVIEKQILPSHRQAQQPIEEAPACAMFSSQQLSNHELAATSGGMPITLLRPVCSGVLSPM